MQAISERYEMQLLQDKSMDTILSWWSVSISISPFEDILKAFTDYRQQACMHAFKIHTSGPTTI